MTMEDDELERLHLADTIAILFDYDGYNTVEGLKSLIDETCVRLQKLYLHEVTRDDVYARLSERVNKETTI